MKVTFTIERVKRGYVVSEFDSGGRLVREKLVTRSELKALEKIGI